MDSTTITSVTSPEETQDNFNTDSNFDKEECFTLRYDETNKFLAAGYSTGFIGIYNLEKTETSFDYKNSYSVSTFPITCLRWKPFNRTTLIAVTAEGFIIQLHSKSGKILQKLEEEKNPFSKKDPNLLMSAGWDNTILLYDIRTKQVQNYLYGPHVCGDGLDLKDDLLLTVSWAKEDQIQLFDLRNNKKLGVFQMVLDENKENSLENISYLYSCRFNPANTTFCVTGSNKNYLRLYDYSNLNLGDLTQSKIKGILDLKDINEPCYCCDYNLKGTRLAYGCAKSKINFIDLK